MLLEGRRRGNGLGLWEESLGACRRPWQSGIFGVLSSCARVEVWEVRAQEPWLLFRSLRERFWWVATAASQGRMLPQQRCLNWKGEGLEKGKGLEKGSAVLWWPESHVCTTLKARSSLLPSPRWIPHHPWIHHFPWWKTLPLRQLVPLRWK